MAWQDKDKEREYNSNYYKRKASRSVQIRDRQRKNRDTIQAYKLERGCSICGYSKSGRALQFHHTDDNKDGNIAKMVAQGASMKRIFEEIDKCVLLCANCHHEAHDEQMLL